MRKKIAYALERTPPRRKGVPPANKGQGNAYKALEPFIPAPAQSSRQKATVFPRSLQEGETPEHFTVDGRYLYKTSITGSLHAFQHGKKATYGHGCRCAACLQGYQVWRTANIKQKRYGTRVGFATAEEGRKACEEARAHLKYLRYEGVSWKEISKQSGLSIDCILTLAKGKSIGETRLVKSQVRTATYRAIMSLDLYTMIENMEDYNQINADLTNARLKSLLADGFTARDIHKAMGRHSSTRMPFNRQSVSVGYARGVREVYRKLHKPTNPHANHSKLVYRIAKEQKWVVPLAWDDPETLVWPKRYRRVNL